MRDEDRARRRRRHASPAAFGRRLPTLDRAFHTRRFPEPAQAARLSSSGSEGPRHSRAVTVRYTYAPTPTTLLPRRRGLQPRLLTWTLLAIPFVQRLRPECTIG
ncbi:hypothetical protein MRX96_039221 [Rhipicephalus microplus]